MLVLILIRSIAVRRPDRRGLGLHPGLPQGHAPGPTRSSRPSCSTTSRSRSSCSGCGPDFLRQEGSSPADLQGALGLRPHPADPRLAGRSGSTAGFVVALLMAAVVSWFLFKTTKGFELRAAGFNMHAARYAA